MPVATHIVAEDDQDIRLDRWFRRHFPGLPQSALQKLCRTGQVRLDGARVQPASRIAAGQTIRVPSLPERPPETRQSPPANPADIARAKALILYQDQDLLVLNKPFGLPSQGGPGIAQHLDGWLTHLRFDRPDKPRLVHRLDRETSGVIVVARSANIAASLAAAFRSRDVEKTYWALVAGRPVPVEGRIDLALVRHGNARGAHVFAATDDDTETAHAITDYRTLDHAGRRLAWLELKPLTGRTHQLRVHCASLDAPILGDVKYGSLRNTDDRGVRNTAVVRGEGLAEGLHLHARRIDLPHPRGGRLVVEAPLPAHMRASFAALGFSEPATAPPRRAP